MSASVLPSLAGPAGQVKSAMSSPSFIRPPQGVGAFPSIMRLLGWHLHRPNRQLELARGRNHHLIASAIPACVHVYYDAAPRHKARSVGMAVRRADRSMGAIERLGFHVVSCFDHVTAEPRGNRAWDAPTLLAAMAGRTQKITLAIDVVNVSLRHPFLLAAQLAVVQAASRGRLEVGLGAGSYGLARFDHQALGIAFPPLAD